MHNVNTFFPQFVQKIKKSVREAQKYYDINIKISILTNPKHYAIISNILLNLIIGGQNRSPRMAGTAESLGNRERGGVSGMQFP